MGLLRSSPGKTCHSSSSALLPVVALFPHSSWAQCWLLKPPRSSVSGAQKPGARGCVLAPDSLGDKDTAWHGTGTGSAWEVHRVLICSVSVCTGVIPPPRNTEEFGKHAQQAAGELGACEPEPALCLRLVPPQRCRLPVQTIERTGQHRSQVGAPAA